MKSRHTVRFYYSRLMFMQLPLHLITRDGYTVVLDDQGATLFETKCFADAHFMVDACNAYATHVTTAEGGPHADPGQRAE